jgi:hypothetical protein
VTKTEKLKRREKVSWRFSSSAEEKLPAEKISRVPPRPKKTKNAGFRRVFAIQVCETRK